MIITREINGVVKEIELTNDEICRAYYEQEFKFDCMDIEDAFCELSDDDLLETYGANRATIEPLIDEMAYEKRRNMDKYEMSWDYARDQAISDVLSRREERTA